jgi:hypothetical protein
MMMTMTTQSKKTSSQSNQAPATALNASFSMVKLEDGTQKHNHKISDFKFTDSSSPINDNMLATMVNGTTTITIKDKPHKIPISIKAQTKM